MFAWTIFPDRIEAAMNQNPISTEDSAFPAMFVVLSSFIGALVWLCVMLGQVQQ